MHTKHVLIISLFALALSGCTGHSTAQDDCKADCLGKLRAQVAACGDDQVCKQKLASELNDCETACETN
ncbi:MAG: hypothetical protein KDK39_17735 [Leptospiraceae bacterium]|nr:hypothetical protein [Leptospiraceae bacterium]